jgi:hypothetical protein
MSVLFGMALAYTPTLLLLAWLIWREDVFGLLPYRTAARTADQIRAPRANRWPMLFKARCQRWAMLFKARLILRRYRAAGQMQAATGGRPGPG